MHSNNFVSLITRIALLAIFALTSGTTQAQSSDSIGWVHREKIRMGWTPERFEQYQMMKDAGMNAVMPRLELDVPMTDEIHAHDQALSTEDGQIMADMLKGSALAKQVGLRYFHCLNFAANSQTYEGGIRDNPARFNDGHLPSPVDPVFFKRTILDRIDRTLKLLEDQNTYALDAVIIDPEMYTLAGALPGDPDYGTFAFESFLHETGRSKPDGATDVKSRKAWLTSEKLDEDFIAWQARTITGFGNQLRDLVHAKRPDAILGYIIYEDRLWFHAMARGLTSEHVPVFIGPESTYSGVMDDNMVTYLQQIRDELGIPVLLVPGVDMGLVKGRIPTQRLEVLPGNIYQRCQRTEGYWVFAIYNFGNTAEEQGAFFNTLAKVNGALDEQIRTGVVSTSLVAAPLPLVLPGGFKDAMSAAVAMKPAPSDLPRASLAFQAPILRGSYVVIQWPEPGQRESLTITAVKLGQYLDLCDTQFLKSDGSLIMDNPIPLGTKRMLWIPDAAGSPCATAVNSGMNSWVLNDVSGRHMIFAEGILGLNAQQSACGRFYFHVPADRKEFGLSLLGDRAETASYSLFDASGTKVKSWDKLTANVTETIAVSTPGIWCIQVDHLVDDGGFGLTDLPNLFALRADDVMVPAK